MTGGVEHGKGGNFLNGWMKLLAAPLISAFITGGVMYVAVRVEIAEMRARQELVLSMLQSINMEIAEHRAETLSVRERLRALEAKDEKH